MLIGLEIKDFLGEVFALHVDEKGVDTCFEMEAIDPLFGGKMLVFKFCFVPDFDGAVHRGCGDVVFE